MPLDVTLTLSDTDLDYFRAVMQAVSERGNGRDEAETVRTAARAVERLRDSTRSPYILRRLDRVARLVQMLDDPQWQLPARERRRVLDGLAYVAEARDLVPDDVPALGLLDDAIMLELVLAELQHELEAYEEFDDYRMTETARAAARTVSRDDWLDARRQALHTRMRERRQRDLARLGGELQPIMRF
jgi:uncharacterized membrane protein YkvA (DUF1232 family)